MSESSPDPERQRKSHVGLVFAWVCLAVFSIGSAFTQDILDHPRRFECFYALGFVGFLLLVWRVRTGAGIGLGPVGLMVAAILLRMPLLWLPCSDDVDRYVWEGRVQVAGQNPYALAPTDPQLTSLRDEGWARMNHPSYTAIYPPLTMMSCAAIAAVWPAPLAFKLVHTGFDLLAFAFLMAWLSRTNRKPCLAIIYGLCPLTLTAFAGEGHNDSLMIATLVGAGYALACGRRWVPALLLGAGVSFKIVAVLLLPWFARRHKLPVLPAILLPACLYLPYVGAGGKLFDSLYRFGNEEFLLSSCHAVVERMLAPHLRHAPFCVRAISALVMIAAVVWSARQRELHRVGATVFGALLVASPVVQYWYLSWALVFVAFGHGWAWIAAAAAMGAYFEVGLILNRTAEWIMPDWVGHFVWGTFLVTWIAQHGWRAWSPRRK